MSFIANNALSTSTIVVLFLPLDDMGQYSKDVGILEYTNTNLPKNASQYNGNPASVELLEVLSKVSSKHFIVNGDKYL